MLWSGRSRQDALADRFRDFVETKPLAGLGLEWERLEWYCRHDPDLLVRLRDADAGKAGNPTGRNQYSEGEGNSDIVTNSSAKLNQKPERGNSLSDTLSRLKKQRPDLYERVVAKELSANAAAIEAGWSSLASLHPPKRDW